MARKDYPYTGSGGAIPPNYERVVKTLADEELDEEIDRIRRYPEAREDPEDWLGALMAEAMRRARESR